MGKKRVPLSQIIFWMVQVNSSVLKTILPLLFPPQILSYLLMFYSFVSFEMSASTDIWVHEYRFI